MEKIDIAIIGAGVVGLAIARQLSHKSARTIVVLEKNTRYGQETSSRNSEVIHSGIYYPGSLLKTRLCLEGKELLYDYCANYKITHFNTGKLVISHDADDDEGLMDIQRQALNNNVPASPLTRKQLALLEPAISAHNALLVASTGIIDSHGLMQALYYQARENHVIFLFNNPVLSIDFDGSGYVLSLPGEKLWTEIVINAAGLNASNMAASVGISLDECRYRLYPCKGEYFKIHRKLEVNHLIYPVPDRMSLGIHLTMDTRGGLRLGPNAFYVQDIEYSVNEEHRIDFFKEAVRYLPSLQLDDLSPDFCGIRPKLQGPDDEVQDFVIQEESTRGFPGLINLIGIESPGLTSSLAIARQVSRIVGGPA